MSCGVKEKSPRYLAALHSPWPFFPEACARGPCRPPPGIYRLRTIIGSTKVRPVHCAGFGVAFSAGRLRDTGKSTPVPATGVQKVGTPLAFAIVGSAVKRKCITLAARQLSSGQSSARPRPAGRPDVSRMDGPPLPISKERVELLDSARAASKSIGSLPIGSRRSWVAIRGKIQRNARPSQTSSSAR